MDAERTTSLKAAISLPRQNRLDLPYLARIVTLVAVYFTITYRRFAGKVSLDHEEGY